VGLLSKTERKISWRVMLGKGTDKCFTGMGLDSLKSWLSALITWFYNSLMEGHF